MLKDVGPGRHAGDHLRRWLDLEPEKRSSIVFVVFWRGSVLLSLSEVCQVAGFKVWWRLTNLDRGLWTTRRLSSSSIHPNHRNF